MPPRPPIYLDGAATAPTRPEAREAMLCAMTDGGNPSSIHGAGRKARDHVERARTHVAKLVNASPERCVFTSGGTEACAIALSSLALTTLALTTLALTTLAKGAPRIIIGATEHDAVAANAARCGLAVTVWPVDAHGVADLAWLKAELAKGPALVALMLANNETGVIQPVAEAAALVREAGGWLHVDAVQAAGKIDVDFNALGAHTMALSAHKMGGPQGVGALVFAEGVRPEGLWAGGGQEQAIRSGTENVPGIAGFGAAAEASLRDLPHMALQAGWRDAAQTRLKAAGCVIAGEAAPRLPHILCAAKSGWEQVRQVMMMDLSGVAVSAGSACSSGKIKPSGVLTAMGLGALAPYSLRASGSWASTEQDWSGFADIWLEADARRAPRHEEVA